MNRVKGRESDARLGTVRETTIFVSYSIYKVVSFFTVAKDLANRWTDKVLLIGSEMFLGYFHIPSNIEPLDARGAAASLQ